MFRIAKPCAHPLDKLIPLCLRDAEGPIRNPVRKRIDLRDRVQPCRSLSITLPPIIPDSERHPLRLRLLGNTTRLQTHRILEEARPCHLWIGGVFFELPTVRALPRDRWAFSGMNFPFHLVFCDERRT